MSVLQPHLTRPTSVFNTVLTSFLRCFFLWQLRHHPLWLFFCLMDCSFQPLGVLPLTSQMPILRTHTLKCRDQGTLHWKPFGDSLVAESKLEPSVQSLHYLAAYLCHLIFYIHVVLERTAGPSTCAFSPHLPKIPGNQVVLCADEEAENQIFHHLPKVKQLPNVLCENFWLQILGSSHLQPIAWPDSLN